MLHDGSQQNILIDSKTSVKITQTAVQVLK